MDHHIDSWVSGCDKLHIPITAKGAQRAIADYRRRQGQPTSETNDKPRTNRPFSDKAFLDGIVEFIVADDQVGILSCIRILDANHVSSPLM